VRLLRDSWLVFDRSMWVALHNPVWIVLQLGQPVVYLLLFGPLLKSVTSVRGFPEGGAYNVFVPGLLIQLALLGLFNGFGLLAELRWGVIERLRVTPMSRVAMLLGRALRDVAILIFQAVLMILVAIPFGLAFDLPGIVAVLVLVGLIGLVTAPFSYAVAFWLRSEDALAPFVNAVALPVLLLSGILLPMSLAPPWLQTISTLNPFSHAVIAARDLLNGHAADPEVGIGIGLMAILAVLSIWVGSRAFSRAAA
jgi:ABC-2 type transport system permease protein